MKIIEQAITYFTKATGNDWHVFFDRLDEAMSGNMDEQEETLWYIHALMDTMLANNISIDELKINKDAVKAYFDNEGRKSNGEFFTPERWCKKGREYFDKYIPDWKENYYVWDNCAGSGNLVRTIEMNDRSRLYMSTLQSDDVELLRGTKEFSEANVFELDYLNSIALSDFDTKFIDSLPEGLQDIIRNDKPLIIYVNPPYKSGKSKSTEVGKFMNNSKTLPQFNFTDFSAASYDIFYQFCFQTMCLVMQYNLKNTYFCFFGPLRFFVGKSAGVLLKHFEHVFEFLDGMCLSAGEFNDIGKEVTWGIGCSIWKSRGDYLDDSMAVYHKDILLDKMIVTPDDEIVSQGKVLYEEARTKLSNWSRPSEDSYSFYKQFPVMTSYHTFKGGNPFERTFYSKLKVIDNMMGCLMTQENLARNSMKCGLLSAPSTIEYICINQSNFWRCVANYTFRRVAADVDWSMTKKDISAPNESIEGYDVWLANALVFFLFAYKSMMSSIRHVTDETNTEEFEIKNHFFYISEEEVKEHCEDEVILEDMKNSPATNQFLLEQIERVKDKWSDEGKELFKFCKLYTLSTYNFRKTVNYKASTDCWDAGFQQIRAGIWKDSFEEEYRTRLNALKSYLQKDILKFGFMVDLEDMEVQ